MIPGETVLTGAEHPGTEIEVIHTPHGFYLGFKDKDGDAYSRETGYMSEIAAQLLHELIRKIQ
jgi:hypothetical protein